MSGEPDSNLQRNYSKIFTRENAGSHNFTIPCTIGNSEMGKALCESGHSINFMPLSVVKRISLGELTPTAMTLQMVDRTLAQP